MTDRRDWEQPLQYLEQSYDQPWQPQPYDLGAHQQPIGWQQLGASSRASPRISR